MSVTAIANQKGGVGKTTTAITLAGCIARREKKTLLIDLDPHGSMTSYFGFDPDSLQNGVYQLFQQAVNQQRFNAEKLLQTTRFPQLTMLPSSTALATLDRQLGTKDGMGLVLSRAIIALQEQFDEIIIDCPPMLGILMINALAACDRLIIPVQTEFLALKGLDRMLRTLQMINKARKRPLNYTIVPTMFDRRTRASIETLRTIRSNYPKEKLTDAIIPVDTKFRESAQAGVPLPLYAPRSRGAVAYEVLFEKIYH